MRDNFPQYDEMGQAAHWTSCRDPMCTCLRCLRVSSFKRIAQELILWTVSGYLIHLEVAEKEAKDWQDYKRSYNKVYA